MDKLHQLVTARASLFELNLVCIEAVIDIRNTTSCADKEGKNPSDCWQRYAPASLTVATGMIRLHCCVPRNSVL